MMSFKDWTDRYGSGPNAIVPLYADIEDNDTRDYISTESERRIASSLRDFCTNWSSAGQVRLRYNKWDFSKTFINVAMWIIIFAYLGDEEKRRKLMDDMSIVKSDLTFSLKEYDSPNIKVRVDAKLFEDAMMKALGDESLLKDAKTVAKSIREAELD